MENLILSYEEQKLVAKHKKRLECIYHVQISLPELTNVQTYKNDLIVATLNGEKKQINKLKKFIEKKMEAQKRKREDRVTVSSNIPVITLSDSSDSDSSDSDISEHQRKIKRRKKIKILNGTPTNCTTKETDYIVDLTSPIVTRGREEVSHSIECESAPAFIPLNTEKENKTKKVDGDDSIIVLEEIQVPKPVEKEPRFLRPVVIDGSNVAREHGKVKNTFSCKGIKLAIDYFLKKGHQSVTAFVPQYRRYCKFGPVFTTDQNLLEELAKEQRVVFTPSRRVNNRRLTCYDDRFIVDLATSTGGVILSNDNYRDLMGESEAYKKTIEERLLMFCFVGDILMIPKDPLGKNGPSLEDFLSMSATEKSLQTNFMYS